MNIWVAFLAPCAPVMLGWWLTRRKVEQIHVLVNSRLDAALAEIKTLKSQLGEPDAEPRGT